MIEEVMSSTTIVKSDPAAVAALARHGVHDLELLQVDPWSTGTLPIDGVSPGRRVIRASAYLREFARTTVRPSGGQSRVRDRLQRGFGRRDRRRSPDSACRPRRQHDVGSVGPLRTDLRPLRSLRARARRSRSPERHRLAEWRLQAHIDPFEGW